MNKLDFYRFIEKGTLQGACRYFEYWFIYENVSNGSKVLEIGGGTSMLGQSLQEKHCKVFGLEIDLKSAQFQQDHGIITRGNIFGQNYDVVINASAIEHFDPEHDGDIKAIAEVYKALKPHGLFIITIPTGSKYIKSRGSPPEKIYNQIEFERRFLKGFEILQKQFYMDSMEKPTEFEPHKGWRVPNFKPAYTFGDNTGLCAVLRKI